MCVAQICLIFAINLSIFTFNIFWAFSSNIDVSDLFQPLSISCTSIFSQKLNFSLKMLSQFFSDNLKSKKLAHESHNFAPSIWYFNIFICFFLLQIFVFKFMICVFFILSDFLWKLGSQKVWSRSVWPSPIALAILHVNICHFISQYLFSLNPYFLRIWYFLNFYENSVWPKSVWPFPIAISIFHFGVGLPLITLVLHGQLRNLVYLVHVWGWISQSSLAVKFLRYKSKRDWGRSR